MNPAIKNLFTWLEMALEYSTPICSVHKRTKLKLVFLLDEEEGELITYYFECPKCNREYQIIIGFEPKIVPRGNGHEEE